LAVALALLASGCVFFRAPVVPYRATVFDFMSFPVDIEFDRTSIPKRVGRASSHSAVLGLFGWGDCSVHAAARNGGIARIEHVDAHVFNVLFLYMRFDTLVYGTGPQDAPPSLGRVDALTAR